MFLFQTDCFHEVFSLIPVLWWRMCSLCFLLEPARGSYSIFCVSCMDGLIPFKNAWPTLASVFILVSMLSGEDTLCLLVSMLSVEDTVCILVSPRRFQFQDEVTRLRPCWFGDTMVCFLLTGIKQEVNWIVICCSTAGVTHEPCDPVKGMKVRGWFRRTGGVGGQWRHHREDRWTNE